MRELKNYLQKKKTVYKNKLSPLRNELSNNKVILLSKIKEEHNFIDELYFI